MFLHYICPALLNTFCINGLPSSNPRAKYFLNVLSFCLANDNIFLLEIDTYSYFITRIKCKFLIF